MVEGQRGFYQPRSWLGQDPLAGPSPDGASWYDTTPMISTLERMVDFDRLNDGGTRVSVGAVDVASGNLEYFDNTRMRLDARHVLASGALPPAFPAVEIDGRYFWDGGLVSNTPLSHVLREAPRADTLMFQVDLWSARGELPRPCSTSPSASARSSIPAARARSPTPSASPSTTGDCCANCSR